MPPEIVNHKEYNSQVDVWSAGVVAYVLLTGKPPFFGTDKDQVYKKINHSDPPMESMEWKIITNDAKDFIK